MKGKSACDYRVGSVEPTLLYMIGADPTDPVVVWKPWLISFNVRLGLINWSSSGSCFP